MTGDLFPAPPATGTGATRAVKVARLQVIVVPTAAPSGANTINVRPPGASAGQDLPLTANPVLANKLYASATYAAPQALGDWQLSIPAAVVTQLQPADVLLLCDYVAQ